jgi:glycosyltransferase involved in cell wall biosynthesis
MEDNPMFTQTRGGGPLVAGVVAVIPAYNEERFIGSVVLQTRKYVDAVVVVDDGSHDRTAEVAEYAGACVLRNETNCGKSAAMNMALDELRKMPVRLAVFIDGDGQHFPEDIPVVVKPILTGEADLVVGSRFLQRKSDIPGWRIFGQHSLTIATNILSGLPLTDSQSGFRAFSRLAMERMRFSPKGGFAVESEMQFLARELNLKIVEVPIGVVYAEGPKRNPVKHGMQILNGLLGLVGQSRPLLFFGGLGMGLVIIALGFGWRTVWLYEVRQELAIGHALITVLFAIVGLLSCFTGVTLHSVRSLFLHYVSGSTRAPAEAAADHRIHAMHPSSGLRGIETPVAVPSRVTSGSAPRPADSSYPGANGSLSRLAETPIGAKGHPASGNRMAG